MRIASNIPRNTFVTRKSVQTTITSLKLQMQIPCFVRAIHCLLFTTQEQNSYYKHVCVHIAYVSPSSNAAWLATVAIPLSSVRISLPSITASLNRLMSH